jgi:streptogramin lyase
LGKDIVATVGGDVDMQEGICRRLLVGFTVILLIGGGRAGASTPPPSGQIFFVEECNHRLGRINDMTGAGWTTLGSYGDGVNGFAEPQGIFVGVTGQIYVADTGVSFRGSFGGNRIVRVDNITGAGWTTFGTKGSGAYQFSSPRGVFVNATGIYAADSGNHRIVRINNMTGAGWTTFGSYGRGVNQFTIPRSIVMTPAGQIYVVDSFNHRIVRIDDFKGRGWTTFGTIGQGINHFTQMTDMFVSPSRQIYVAESIGAIVRFDDMTGAGWTTLGGFDDGVASISMNAAGQIFAGGYDRISRVNDMTGTGRTIFRPGIEKGSKNHLCGPHVAVR